MISIYSKLYFKSKHKLRIYLKQCGHGHFKKYLHKDVMYFRSVFSTYYPSSCLKRGKVNFKTLLPKNSNGTMIELMNG